MNIIQHCSYTVYIVSSFPLHLPPPLFLPSSLPPPPHYPTTDGWSLQHYLGNSLDFLCLQQFFGGLLVVLGEQTDLRLLRRVERVGERAARINHGGVREEEGE